MIGEIISVGTEILLGNIVNTNATYLAEQFAALGIDCYFQSCVGDNEERLTMILKAALKRSDVIILTGGLGPTQDDLTKEIVSKVMGYKLVEDKKAKEMLEIYFKNRGIEISDNNWKQALVPHNSIVLYNDNGTAPGIIIEKDNKHVILLPGPPSEMQPLFEKYVVDYLKSKNPFVISSVMVKLCGIGESKVAEILDDMISKQKNPTVAPYAKTGEVHLRITAKAENEKDAMKLIRPVVKKIKTIFGEKVYTTDENVTLEQSVVDLLLAHDLTICAVESCTGGLFSAHLINVSGVSEVYKFGHITYSNKAKKRIVGVKKRTLDKYTAVSSQVATEMVKGAGLLNKADVAVAITGIAGPEGGTKDIPVGTVFIACDVKGKTTVKEYHFKGNRSKIRENAVAAALTQVRICVLEYITEVSFGKKGEK